MIKVIVCGPESTGKTTLARFLAGRFNGAFVPEYAREYIGQLNRNYTYDDVIAIAEKQIEKFQSLKKKDAKFVFFDTGLIITKIWFLEVFGSCPTWIDEQISLCKPNLYFLCHYDLPWEFDPLRENGSNERRAFLFDKYLEEIKKTGCNYKIIKGFKEERYNLAIETLKVFAED